jgi:hypothetical protein
VIAEVVVEMTEEWQISLGLLLVVVVVVAVIVVVGRLVLERY